MVPLTSISAGQPHLSGDQSVLPTSAFALVGELAYFGSGSRSDSAKGILGNTSSTSKSKVSQDNTRLYVS